MEDKRTLLKQIGWSDELIDKCLSMKIVPDREVSVDEYYSVTTVFEQDTTTLTINIDTPVISDGTHFLR